MKKIIILHAFTGIFLLFSIAANATTSEGKPAYQLNRQQFSLIQVFLDTIPVPVKPVQFIGEDQVTEKPVASIIKVVPKVRKLSVPKPVSVKVIPIKIIKPRIIKPILKLL